MPVLGWVRLIYDSLAQVGRGKDMLGQVMACLVRIGKVRICEGRLVEVREVRPCYCRLGQFKTD
jgi:hypothetical protein